MEKKIENNVVEKRRSKVVAFNLSEDVISKFNDKVGYNYRSKIVNGLISNFVNKNGNPTPARRKTDKPLGPEAR